MTRPLTNPANLTIRAIDLNSDEDMKQLNILSSACSMKLYGHPSNSTVEERRAILMPTSYYEAHHWVAEISGRVLGIVMVSLPLKENLNRIDFAVAIHPDYEGQGLEEALTHHALEHAIVPSGRTGINYYGYLMQGEDLDNPNLAINIVADLLGVTVKNTAITRVAPLPLSPEIYEEIRQKASPDSTYSFELWANRLPDAYIDSAATAYRQLDLDEPTGEAQGEAGNYTAERLREMEQRTADAGEGILYTAAIYEGSIAALSVLTYPLAQGNVSAWQNSTVVMPAHRGQGLSRQLKLLSHTRLPQVAPHIKQIITMNSELNPAMIKVNEELGYRVVWHEVCYQN